MMTSKRNTTMPYHKKMKELSYTVKSVLLLQEPWTCSEKEVIQMQYTFQDLLQDGNVLRKTKTSVQKKMTIRSSQKPVKLFTMMNTSVQETRDSALEKMDLEIWDPETSMMMVTNWPN